MARGGHVRFCRPSVYTKQFQEVGIEAIVSAYFNPLGVNAPWRTIWAPAGLSDAELRQAYRGCLFTLFPSLGRLRARAHHRARSARAGRAGKVMRPASRAGRYFSPDRSSGAAFRRHHGPASTARLTAALPSSGE
jgi:hypothetical protein